VTGTALAADASAYFVNNGLLTKPCGASLYLYHSASEANGPDFTAGRVTIGTFPTGPKYSLEVDTGDSDGPALFELDFS